MLAGASGARSGRAHPSRCGARHPLEVDHLSGRAPSCAAILSRLLSGASNFFGSKFLVLLLTICEATWSPSPTGCGQDIPFRHGSSRSQLEMGGTISGKYGITAAPLFFLRSLV